MTFKFYLFFYTVILKYIDSILITNLFIIKYFYYFNYLKYFFIIVFLKDFYIIFIFKICFLKSFY